MYSFAIEGFRPPTSYNSTIARMRYNRIRKLESGLFAVDHLGHTAVETTSPTVTGVGLHPNFEIVDFGESGLRQIYKTEETDVDSLEALVSSASEAWRKLLDKSEVKVVKVYAHEVRKPKHDPNELVVVSLDEAAAFMDGKSGPSEFSHFVANADEHAAMQRITESIPIYTPDLTTGLSGHGPHI